MDWKTLMSARRLGQKNIFSPDSRSAFEQDYDRIIFSHPFRRLQDKTQVHPLPEQDFVHTRLTHSLEVSSVGRSLGRRAGEQLMQRHPDLKQNFSFFDFGAVVAAASLAHDLGNPPFGHAGEDAISEFFRGHPDIDRIKQQVSASEWEDLVNFEGNAQGFRIISKGAYGLRLTLATLGAFTKYPCPALFPERDRNKKSQKKFGYFQSERQQFEEVSTGLGLHKTGPASWCRHPLAFLVEAADDICYSIIDLEDACRLGLVSFSETVELLAEILREKLDRNKLKTPSGLNEKLGMLRSMAIGELIDACIEVFLDNEAAILDGKFDSALTDHCRFSDALGKISALSIEKIYRAKHVVEIEASGHQVLPGLLEEFTKTGEHILSRHRSRKYDNLRRLLPEEVTSAISAENNYYLMMRQIVDHVSGLTDKHALSLYRKIKGISL